MSYIGNQVTSVPHIIDTFTGTGTGTSFGPLTRAPAGTAAIAVFITGSYQIPGVDYTLNGDYINFTSAPFNLATIVVHHLGNGTTTQVPSDGSVTGTKLAINSVRGNNIVAGQITGNLIGTGAVSGNQIGVGAVSGNQIGVGAVSGNSLGLYSVSGNNLGIGSVSANNFAGGGITSNVLSSNLQLSVSQVTERINISGSSGFYGGTPESTGITGNLNIDIMNSTVHFFEANTTANITFNLRGNSTHQFGQVTSVGNSISMVVRLKHNVSQGRAQVNVHIDGTRCDSFAGTTGNLLLYAGNTIPGYSTILRDEYNMYGLTIFKTSTSSYSVMMSNTIFSRGI
jgi:hypothetical protein